MSWTVNVTDFKEVCIWQIGFYEKFYSYAQFFKSEDYLLDIHKIVWAGQHSTPQTHISLRMAWEWSNWRPLLSGHMYAYAGLRKLKHGDFEVLLVKSSREGQHVDSNWDSHGLRWHSSSQKDMLQNYETETELKIWVDYYPKIDMLVGLVVEFQS